MLRKYCVLLTIVFFNYSCGLNENPSIIVIGAGPSGIAAATKLWKNNFTNLTILEAENRIGGRIRSINFGDAYLDVGAEWCHGEVDNIVYNMVKEYDILRHADISVQLYYSNGTLLDQQLFDNFVKFSESIVAAVNDTEIEESCGNLSSVGECFDVEFNSTITEIYQNNSDLQTIGREAEEWLEGLILVPESAFSMYDIALKSDYKECEGDQGLHWDGRGYKTILELMLQQYPDPSEELGVVNNILLNKEVTKIIWDSTRQVTVLCWDNTTYAADHVIITPSIGVLKANHERLFQPGLPGDKIRAISNIGFGAIMKIILHFPYAWFNSTQPYGFIWSAEDGAKILTEYGKGPVKDGRSWLTTIVVFFPAENNPKVLIGFLAGEMIPELEQETDEVLISGCMYTFRKFLSGTHGNITDPDKIIRSTWYNNPHFRGTYSYDSTNKTEEGLRGKLAAPLSHKSGTIAVQFAGEATHPYHFGTVHGAIESGYREADRLIHHYAKQ